MFNKLKRWKPKGKMYTLRCFQCGSRFLSSLNLEAPICGKCIQKAKSLDSTEEYEKGCSKCGNRRVIYGKAMCHSCYFVIYRNNLKFFSYSVIGDGGGWPKCKELVNCCSNTFHDLANHMMQPFTCFLCSVPGLFCLPYRLN